ncbi:hypothetical protein H112_05421 [Trichophyton rubrum D6]|uniref:Diaminohydroxyphosphoribosylamino-pyrimidine deaminase n=4 Tax=Trichophyton TaxID=5550 RepID=A0A178EPW9_TRIRU|nr:uncharacterized protein TERG_03162 [Trichophyton rubrum CBS 118892]EZF17136.1 hypothetical protein H100_05440 [Trichophyton rubrum MR850]EZF40632.1 hypothetical protein H102_05404 [Trichophyton rubrum CBS 100081]EZF51214.1 hypothetical protein H103_05433 [Trichophyton rubrum CBS 288.86]EZF61849.1 hypothetical protein H104_05420 [Trichophyton rubrum CBS 289.86]EZF72396.1 hypothetical protein H105_05448 [Trichophyton soudanense CBS 452.61]EZF83104.1 hypothetical protein H110_05428 [Trichophy
MDLLGLLGSIGHEVEDAEDDAFIQFSHPIPSSNLGFVDPRSNTVELTVGGEELTIRQSPTILSSKRTGGTTGAVLWQVTPKLAEWLCKKDNPLWKSSVLNSESAVVELGCGTSAVLAISLGPKVGCYAATDQEYVRKLFNENLHTNGKMGSPSSYAGSTGNRSGKRIERKGGKHHHHHHHPRPERERRNSPARRGDDESGSGDYSGAGVPEKIKFVPLDWELDSPDMLKRSIGTDVAEDDPGFDLLVACDCIYNDALIAPFVATCADICRLRPSVGEERPERPTLCVVGQQLRSHEVFEGWMREALQEFRVWRVKNEVVGSTLASGTGYTVHILLLKGGN